MQVNMIEIFDYPNTDVGVTESIFWDGIKFWNVRSEIDLNDENAEAQESRKEISIKEVQSEVLRFEVNNQAVVDAGLMPANGAIEIKGLFQGKSVPWIAADSFEVHVKENSESPFSFAKFDDALELAALVALDMRGKLALLAASV